MSTNVPLWQVMKDAYMAPPTTATEEQCYAAELRAIAEKIERHPQAIRCPEWDDVANWLRSEAYRAEVE